MIRHVPGQTRSEHFENCGMISVTWFSSFKDKVLITNISNKICQLLDQVGVSAIVRSATLLNKQCNNAS
ncbi:hypothetical protein CSB45_06700 [candidate division KSB3 bacterium]|uniref:Uncharacterized protein n=1 Tax=candidate division KSB3 bacterium TaxID=2044937 RepID=A0A2G6E6I7_9BACT|nr:MAG: hypothetical protein CSB45_06700 [candidate division KSB3 bacterium]PIE30076.1 MAG: hypothetical protein CSA57_05895 [candidate division KSB3 bacterium]